MHTLISILVPCLNESRYITSCIRSVLHFDLPAGVNIEVLVLDGRSSDNTRELVLNCAKEDGRVRLIDNVGKIQSIGLNIGINESRGQWIMRLDAHASYPSDYLKLCYETALATNADNVGGICITLPGDHSYQAQMVQAITTHKFGVGNSGFRTQCKAGKRDTVPFGFFKRDIFSHVGLFDERLVRTQDYEFNCRIKAFGGNIFLNPQIQSTYYNLARLDLFYKKQLHKQGPFNAYMWFLAPYSFTLRHAITAAFATFFWTGLALSFFSALQSLYLAILGLYFSLAFISALQQSKRYGFLRHAFCLPLGFFLFHVCHGTGVLLGISRMLLGIAPIDKGKEPWIGAHNHRTSFSTGKMYNPLSNPK